MARNIRTIRHKIGAAAVVILAVLCLIPLSAAIAGKTDMKEVGKTARDPMVNIMLGKAEMVEIGGNVADILVANPGIVDVMAVKSDRLYLVGTQLGETNIMVLDAAGNILKRMNVHVQMDIEKLDAMVDELYPDEDVQIRALTDQVVLTGNVSTPSTANAIAGLVAQYVAEIQGVAVQSVDGVITNMLTVRGEEQVMLRVKIVEATRNALKDLGLETDTDGEIGAVTGAFGTAAALGLTAPQQLGTLALNYDSGSFGPLNFIVRALEQEGIVNTLAEPNLTAISGEQAGFLAGGEIPIPTQVDQNGNLIYEYRPFGVSLNFRPIVLSSNRISLELTTEVSTTTFDDNLLLQGINVPTFNVRRAQTTVELPSGGTLMIAGLLQSDTVSGLTQLPGAENLPVIGDLVKSDTFSRDESELVVMITPYLVKPFAENKANDVSDNAPYSPISSLPQQQPGLPAPQRDENRVTSIFGNTIRRVYGKNAPETLMAESGTFGYIIE